MEEYSKANLMIATANGQLFDYVANHYTEMSKYDLKEVILAVLGVCYDNCYGDDDEKALAQLIVGELESRYFGEDEE